MDNTESLRKRLGISQDTFAVLVDCSNGLVSMVECGKRSFPDASYPYLAALELAYVQAKNGLMQLPPYNQQTIAWLNKQIRTGEARRNRLQIQLETLDATMEELKLLINAASIVGINPLFVMESTKGLQLQVVKRKAQHKLDDCQFKLVQLQISIAALDAEIAKASELKLNNELQ